ncbi:MAG TPA: adenylate/guanylate cyclase domain-containing protein [Acidimicrobiia bacterium]|nr:adenylate/guanylate cyclase domain-containing protein [Acidimicrobiia bacterium]
MTELPSGTVTFLFTDVEGSTRLWEQHPETMRSALARHDEIIGRAIASHGGCVVKTTGDGFHAVFATAIDAIDAALAAQVALTQEGWGDTEAFLVRMGVHTGASELRDDDYYGTAVNRAARLMAVAHGGQVVSSQVTADLARDDLDEAVSLTDLGEHRLRDLGSPERVFQVTCPELRKEFPALRALDTYPGNLPLQMTEFVGREDELAALSSLLDRSRLVTLTGTGGVGKTRLAVQAAAAALPHFSDGAWFVDLAPIDDELFVAGAVVTAMELPEHRQGNHEEALVGALARRHALVVLDNCEHLVEAVARIVDLIVRRCPAVTVLATSQEVLGVDGEATFAVRPLPGNDAERLFVERATAARHGFELTSDNSAAITELCRRLDGIPLAIELAAARVASMSPAAILERLDERFRLLGHGRRMARRRHQTLRAAVDWSYALLGAREQTVLQRLSVFAGDFTLEAAEAVVSDDDIDTLDILDLVADLVAKSMVQVEEAGESDRYRLLETMRDYGLERLAAGGDVDRLQQRHAAYYTTLVETAAPHFVGPDDTVSFRRIDQEYPNIRAALVFTRERDPSDFVRLVFALHRFWHFDNRFREGLAWITAAHAAAPETSGRVAAGTLAVAGIMATSLTRWDEAEVLVQRSLERSAADGEAPHPMAFLVHGLVALEQTRGEDARRFSEEAVTLARANGHPFELAEALSQAGLHIALTSDDPRGAALADEGVHIARSLGNHWALSYTLQAAGTARYRADPARAIVLLQEAFDLQSEFGSVTVVNRSMKAFAHLAIRDEEGAAAELLLALPALHEAGFEYYLSIALAGAALLLRRRGEAEISVRLLALNERLRDDGRILGAPRDLEGQEQLKARLERELERPAFERLWAEGRAMSVDDAVTLALEGLVPIAQPQ